MATAVPLSHWGFGTWISQRPQFGGENITGPVIYSYGSVEPGEKEGLYKLFDIAISSTSAGIMLGSSGISSTPPALYLTYSNAGNTKVNSRLRIYTNTGQTAQMQVSDRQFYTGDNRNLSNTRDRNIGGRGVRSY